MVHAPTELQPVDFHERYVPPPPPEPGQRRLPEEIEAELKKQEEELEKLALASIEEHTKDKKKKKDEKVKETPKKKGKRKGGKKKAKKTEDDAISQDTYLADLGFSHFQTALHAPKKEEVVEEEEIIDPKLFNLGLIQLKLPGHVLWFEPPVITGWNEEEGFWSTEDFHDLKFNEEKQVITFRTGKFGPVGLAAYRYSNLPYQTWELKPYHKGEGVCFNITAAVMIVEFIIKNDKVCVNQLQNGATEALQEIVGNYCTPYQLRKLLCNGGVDLFPAHDAYCYIDGATPKHRAAEDHLYHCMALLSTSHNFAWSRWNLLAGRRNLVLQMKELVDKKRQMDYALLLVTPLKACIVECTEMSQSFSDEGMGFYSDLYHLVQEQGSFAAKSRINEIPFTLAETVFEMLATTRVLSFS